MNSKIKPYYFILLIISLTLVSPTLIYSWVEPISPSLDENVSAPLSVGEKHQIKEGNLKILGDMTLNKNKVPNTLLISHDNVGIETTINSKKKLTVAERNILQTTNSPTKVGQLVDEKYLNYPTSIYVSEKYAYVTSTGSNALVIIDISNPASPIRVGQITGAENYLDGAISVYVSGKYAYVASSVSNALVIIDISGLDVPYDDADFNLWTEKFFSNFSSLIQKIINILLFLF